MPWRESLVPARMERVALVARAEDTPAMLAVIASSGSVDLDLPGTRGEGNEEFERAVSCAVPSGPLLGFVGWVPALATEELREKLTVLGAAIVPLAYPPGVQPPTLLRKGQRPDGVSRSLVDTYGTVPYADLDPSRIAGFAYVVMFGIMFGDVGHGAILVLAGLILRTGRPKRAAKWQRIWLFVAAAGISAMVFGALYGEAFGPTGLIPVLWISPLEEPVTLLIAGILVGSILLAVSYTIGTINRVREGGWGYALYSRTGLAGSALFIAAGILTLGILWGTNVLIIFAVVLATLALGFIFVGLYVDAGGGGTGIVQAVMELFNTVVGLGSNIVSFARLAAFGLTHAALLAVVWSATTALWGPSWTAIAAVLIFVVGNVLTFALEALVAGIQALRLEYYELFSRIFDQEGRSFRPWAPVIPSTESGHPTSAQQNERNIS